MDSPSTEILSTTLKTMKDLVSTLTESTEDAETRKFGNEVMEQVLRFQSAIFDFRDQLAALQEENRDLKEKLSLKDEVFWENPFYWKRQGDQKDGPYCQKCYDDVDSILVHLIDDDDCGFWRCLTCRSSYQGPNYRAPTDGTDSRPWRGF